ncbi:hypothetical protein [Frankia sp. R82]|uniref:hypothetical protein n=1 Tax=Frankia sp. R82 TaxID=2950553 RepID=UPI002043CC10|nr:hypothetical protein [Frankia sp. R82]MCM3887450.1 hypothetical protein [Frankia sp. R82]
MLTVCRWRVEEILVSIVAAPGYCSGDCQDADPATRSDLVRPGYCQPPVSHTHSRLVQPGRFRQTASLPSPR